MVINNIFRGAGILLFILILIMDDFPFYVKMKEPYVQLILAIFTVCILLFDYILGFIVTMILLLIYYEIYKKIEISKNKKTVAQNIYDTSYILNPLEQNKILEKFNISDNDKINNTVQELDYITEEHLKNAQTNYVNIMNYNNDISKELDTSNYGIQGLSIGDDNYKIIGYNSDYSESYNNYI